MILSGFGDEISDDLNEQLRVMSEEGLRYLELRGVWGKNVLQLTDEEAKKVKHILMDYNFKISAIGSPIGKIGINDDFAEHLRNFKRTLELAKFFETHYIRIFSYYIPEGERPEKYRDEVIKRMEKKVQWAEREDVILVHENERGIYGDIPERCRDILSTIDSPYLRANFDPANFVFENVKPYQEAFPLLEEFTSYVHIKDALHRQEKVICVPAGEGEAEVKEVLKALRDNGYQGFLSLEPHLAEAGQYRGFSGPDKFREAATALKKILDELNIDYS
ncbi:sugar phosphate isomerase/epimerase [Candidatus Calescamantes bacterium]|nr:sugar phosphate isomerase/epimerase [Candidatus Calescamantes bacterium]